MFAPLGVKADALVVDAFIAAVDRLVLPFVLWLGTAAAATATFVAIPFIIAVAVVGVAER